MEIWVDKKWYEWIYQISNLGVVKSLSRDKYTPTWFLTKTKERILKTHNDKSYSIVKLWKDWNRKNFKVHRLVWEAFLWLDINNSKELVLHKKEELINWLLDNQIDNLWLWTHKDNSKDCVKKWRNPWLFKINKNA